MVDPEGGWEEREEREEDLERGFLDIYCVCRPQRLILQVPASACFVTSNQPGNTHLYVA